MLRLELTGRAEGNLGLHTLAPGEDPAAALRNRERVLARMGLTLPDLVVGEQVHGARVREVTRADRGRGALSAEDAFGGVDGLVTRDRGVALMVLGADCPLVCLYDAGGPAVAVAHAGWRGLVAGVLGAAVSVLGAADPARIRAVMSACAGPCCYEVGEEVAARFPGSVRRRGRGRRPTLDLAAAVERALGREVARPFAECTVCGGGWFSHREDGTRGRQALVAAIGRDSRKP